MFRRPDIAGLGIDGHGVNVAMAVGKYSFAVPGFADKRIVFWHGAVITQAQDFACIVGHVLGAVGFFTLARRHVQQAVGRESDIRTEVAIFLSPCVGYDDVLHFRELVAI